MRGVVPSITLALVAVGYFVFGTAEPASAVGSHYLRFPWTFAKVAYITQGYNGISHQNGDYYALDLDIQGAGILGEVRAAVSGKVVFVQTGRTCDGVGYGNYVDVRTTTPTGATRYARYAHLSSVAFPTSQLGVYRGQKIGIEGNTGYTINCQAHLHFRWTSSQNCSSSSCAQIPEPMSGQSGFANGQTKTSNNYPFKADFSGDGCPDGLSTKSNGEFWLTKGNCETGWLSSGAIGFQWNIYVQAFQPGDFTGDGCADVLSTKYDGTMWLTRGNCEGGWLTWPDGTWSKVIGWGWDIYYQPQTISPGDFSGDGCSDVLSTKLDGTIWLTRGDCAGGWLTWPDGTWSRVIGYEWNVYDLIFAPGDFDGDGCADVMSRKFDGTLWLTRGNCAGGWLTWPDGTWSKVIGYEWGIYNHVVGGRDFGADGGADVLSTKSTGLIYLTRGDGAGGWLLWPDGTWSKVIGSGWQNYNRVLD